MPDSFDLLVRLLTFTPHRVSAAGEITLTVAEAQALRACGFRTATAGSWKIPPLPEWMIRSHPQLKAGDRSTTGATCTRPPDVTRAAVPPNPTSRRDASPARAGETPPNSLLRVRGWLVQQATPAHLRILQSLLASPSPVAKRTLQQRIHRLKAANFNRALDGLIAVGLVQRDGRQLALSGDVRTLLVQAQISVNRGLRARTMRQPDRRIDSARRTARRQSRPRRYRRRPIPNRHVDPHGWAMAMLGRLGGLKSQAQYRARGVKSTEKATWARLVKRQRQRQQPSAAPAVTVPSPTSTLAAHDALGVSRVSTISATGLSAAYRHNQPIGRDARLAELRTRRR